MKIPKSLETVREANNLKISEDTKYEYITHQDIDDSFDAGVAAVLGSDELKGLVEALEHYEDWAICNRNDVPQNLAHDALKRWQEWIKE